jgi:hypothetical protein
MLFVLDTVAVESESLVAVFVFVFASPSFLKSDFLCAKGRIEFDKTENTLPFTIDSD